jgi:hypothetical protein
MKIRSGKFIGRRRQYKILVPYGETIISLPKGASRDGLIIVDGANTDRNNGVEPLSTLPAILFEQADDIRRRWRDVGILGVRATAPELLLVAQLGKSLVDGYSARVDEDGKKLGLQSYTGRAATRYLAAVSPVKNDLLEIATHYDGTDTTSNLRSSEGGGYSLDEFALAARSLQSPDDEVTVY